MKRIALVCTAGLVLAALVRADTPKAKGGDDQAIRGTWLPSSAALAGHDWPESLVKSIRLVLTDGKYTATVGKQDDKGTWKLDPAGKPKTLDIVGTDGPNKGRTILAIYELTGDTLRVCYDLSGKARPTEFKSLPDTQLFLVTYRRAKP